MTAAATGRHIGVGAPPIADRAWFDRPAVQVAADLLGMLLIHESVEGPVAGRIVEVEAYQGPEDLAAHSARGMTPRNAVMFGPAGHLYVYLVYGLHHCANVVCGPGAKPEAVLLRAAQIVQGEALARKRRGDVPATSLAAGPGNLGAAFGLDRSLNGVDLLTGPVRLAPGEAPKRVERTPRVGVDYAGEWVSAPLRFSIADDRYRSRV
jgi:DNA-3-methyladenine glycosylase